MNAMQVLAQRTLRGDRRIGFGLDAVRGGHGLFRLMARLLYGTGIWPMRLQRVPPPSPLRKQRLAVEPSPWKRASNASCCFSSAHITSTMYCWGTTCAIGFHSPFAPPMRLLVKPCCLLSRKCRYSAHLIL